MGEAIELLVAGQLDAAIIYPFHPSGQIEAINRDPGIRFLSFSKEDMKVISDNLLGWKGNTVPANTYKGQDKPFTHMGYSISVLVSKDLPDDVVYNILAAGFKDGGRRWNELHPSLAGYDFVEEAVSGVAIPFHPGALKYWKAWGMKIPRPVSETKPPKK
jgi:TRAP transporter TAXI family solute receptor